MTEPSKARERAELLPCPFCGGEAILTEIPAHTHKIATFMPDHSGSAMVECGGCSCGMIADNAAAVIEAWSARAPVTCPDTAGGRVPDGWKLVPCEPTEDWILDYMHAVGKTNPHTCADNIQTMLSAAPTPPAETGGWQPIETAPKDGRKVLVWCGHAKSPAPFVATWENGWWVSLPGKWTVAPTCWQQISPPDLPA